MGLGGERFWRVRHAGWIWLPCSRLLVVGVVDAGSFVDQAWGQAVVLGEVARCGLTDPELDLEPVGGLLGDVFVERARGMARFEDAQNRLVSEGSEAGSMSESIIDVLGREALAKNQDAPGDASPVARRASADLLGPRICAPRADFGPQ